MVIAQIQEQLRKTIRFEPITMRCVPRGKPWDVPETLKSQGCGSRSREVRAQIAIERKPIPFPAHFLQEELRFSDLVVDRVKGVIGIYLES